MSRLFSKCRHPYVSFLYFAAAICLTVCIKNPVFLAASLFCSVFLNFFIKNWRAFRSFRVLLPFFFFVSFLNPLVSHWGSTVLFNVLGDPSKPYTLEALLYGMNMGLMFLCMVMWFLGFTKIMTTEKFTFIFGSFFPAVSLMIVMILRLLPFVRKRSDEIKEGRRAIGSGSEKNEKIQEFSAVFSSTLEDGIFMAQSMENRGWGKGKRTSFLTYRFTLADGALVLGALILISVVIFCEVKGGSSMSFYPKMIFNIEENRFFLPELTAFLGEMFLLVLCCRK